jgi:hypothetical protein
MALSRQARSQRSVLPRGVRGQVFDLAQMVDPQRRSPPAQLPCVQPGERCRTIGIRFGFTRRRGLTRSHRPLYSAGFAIPWLRPIAKSPCGGIGRRARLKIEFRKECWFDSGQGHQRSRRPDGHLRDKRALEMNAPAP